MGAVVSVVVIGGGPPVDMSEGLESLIFRYADRGPICCVGISVNHYFWCNLHLINGKPTFRIFFLFYGYTVIQCAAMVKQLFRFSAIIACPGVFSKMGKYFFLCCFSGIAIINSCTYQMDKQHIKEVFDTDYICSKNDICKDATISYCYKCEISQLNAILEKEIKKISQEDNEKLIAFLTPSHSFYFEMTKRGNGHLYIPVSQTKFAAIKIYDSCDDASLFIPHQASICIKDINLDGLLDLHIKFNLHHINGKTYLINRFFLQKGTVFCEFIE